jgi:hypothetical protein
VELGDLITKLVTNDELSTSRVGIVSAGREPAPMLAGSAETIRIDARASEGGGPACELVVADAREDSVEMLLAAARRLSRDGILVAAVRSQDGDAAAEAVATHTDWVAVLANGGADRFVVAAMDVHPDELGPLVADHVVHPVRQGCVNLPQNQDDRARRRFVRRYGRDRMMALANRLLEQHGESVRRIVEGIELLVAERAPEPDSRGRRPGMFTVPGLEAEPWPDPARYPQLKRLVDACERYGPEVCRELREMVGSEEFAAYLPDDYNMKKFQLGDAAQWSAVRLIDWRNPKPDLPPHCEATRQLLSELAAHVSGEVNILRVAANTWLPPHYDDYDCEQYIQIGLSIPPECAIRVGGEARTWEEGRTVVFNPAFLHEVWNHSEQPRDVVAIDLWHADLTDVEIQAIHQVRNELELLRRERNQMRARQQ